MLNTILLIASTTLLATILYVVLNCGKKITRLLKEPFKIKLDS
jgi:hypothetical protein